MTVTLRRIAYGIAMTVAAFMVPAVALAAEAAAVPWQAQVGKAMGAGMAMGLSALGAGYAQGKIGAAGAGTLAERPEVATNIIILQVLPEIIALLGFALAFVIVSR